MAPWPDERHLCPYPFVCQACGILYASYGLCLTTKDAKDESRLVALFAQTVWDRWRRLVAPQKNDRVSDETATPVSDLTDRFGHVLTQPPLKSFAKSVDKIDEPPAKAMETWLVKRPSKGKGVSAVQAHPLARISEIPRRPL